MKNTSSSKGVRCANPLLVLPDEPDMNDSFVLKRLLEQRTIELWAKEKEISRLTELNKLDSKKITIKDAFKFLVNVIREKL